MGYGTRNNGQIRTFTPDNTVTEFYIEGYCNMVDAYEQAIEHFGDLNICMDELVLSAHRIHTDCLGYDLHDPSDWTDYILITWNKS